MEDNKKREEMIQGYIKKGEYERAFKALVALIEIMNIKIIKEKLKKNLKSNNFYKIMELYRNNNAELYDIMQEINLIYEDYTNIKKVDLNLVQNLEKSYYEIKDFYLNN